MSVGFDYNPGANPKYGPAEEGPMPYVTFHDRAVEDRNASIRDGVTRYKNVTFVRVISAGSRDTFENVAEDWISYIEFKAGMQMYSPVWAEQFRAAYEQYKAKGHADLVGTPIKMAAFLNAGEIESCLAANIYTLEGLAGCGEDGLKNIGIGARVMQQKAQSYLSQQEGGKVAQQMAAITAQIDALRDALSERDELISSLKTELTASRKPGRRRHEAMPAEVEEESEDG